MGLNWRDAWRSLRHGRVVVDLAAGQHSTSLVGLPAERWDTLRPSAEWGLATVDDLVAEKGLAVYREMLRRDDQVSSCVSLLQLARLASGWEIAAASNAEEDKRCAKYVRHAFERMRSYSVNRLLSDAMDAVPIGFAVLEAAWDEPEEYGEWRGFQGYRCFKPLPQETITFHRDEHGDIDADGVWQVKAQQQGAMVTPGLDPAWFNKLERDRFVLWFWRSQYGNPLGLSILRAAYGAYFFKQFTIKHWARYMERYGMPRVCAEIPEAQFQAKSATVLDALRRYQSELAMVVQSGVKLTVDEPSTTATMNYEAAVAWANKAIAHACLLPSTILDNTEGGSYALAKAQKSTFTWILDNLGNLLADEVMQEQVIRPLVMQNFGPQYELPKFVFSPYEQRDNESIARMVDILARAGMNIPTQWIRETLGIPEAVEGEAVLVPPQPAAVPSSAASGLGLSQEEADLNAVIADMVAARGDRDDSIDVLRGNGKRTKAARRW